MMSKVKNKIAVGIYCLFTLLQLGSCSLVGDEGECQIGYINYRYVNSAGENNKEQIFKMTDFIFNSDSVLYRVDDDIMNGEMYQRPINLPDGEWIVVTYGNLNGNSLVDYNIGETKLSEMSVRVNSTPTHRGVYAAKEGTNIVGNSDQFYYGRLKFRVKGGYTDQRHTVTMSNAHIWLNGVITWTNKTDIPAQSENLNLRLEYVPVEHSFLTDERYDSYYGLDYSVPRITNETASYVTKLYPNLNAEEFTFSMHGMRWETGKAPVLRIYDGDIPLVDKDFPLNKYFQDNGIDLTQTRVQFFNLSMVVDGSNISVSNLMIDDWEDGGNIGDSLNGWN